MKKLQVVQAEKQSIQDRLNDFQKRLVQAELEKKEFESLQHRLEKDKQSLKRTLDSVRSKDDWVF